MTVDVMNVQQQKGGNDCGVYVGNIRSPGPYISEIFGPAGPEIGGTDYAVTLLRE